MLTSKLLAAAGNPPLVQSQKLLASDFSSDDRFGTAVAISGDGLTLAVGAPREDTTPYSNNGAVYVFTYASGTWTQQQKLLASDYYTSSFFGIALSLSNDGNTLIVGSADSTTVTNGGAAYVFTRTAGVWTQQQKITPAGLASNDYFGYSVSLSGDGNTALIGAYSEDLGVSSSNYGSAYVYTRSGGVWTLQQEFNPAIKNTNMFFGFSCALSEDGNTALIGAYGFQSNVGRAYVFVRVSGVWSEQAVLSGTGSTQSLGRSVAISSDGNIAVAGAYSSTIGSEIAAGSGFIWTRTGTSWTQRQYINASDYSAYANFGQSCSISGDGSTIYVGAYHDSVATNQRGAAYVFMRNGSSYNWQQVQKLKGSDALDYAYFGVSLMVNRNNTTLIVGADEQDTSPQSQNGAAYIFV